MLKSLERLGRRALFVLLRLFFSRRSGAIRLPPQPRILVIRADARVGNAVLTTPLLDDLARVCERPIIDLVGPDLARPLLEGHPALHAFIPFVKKPWLGSRGLVRLPRSLRRHRYDLCIDAGNPTDPSLTQAWLTLGSRAHSTVGVEHPLTRGLYTAAAKPPSGAHEIALRGAVLEALGARPETMLPRLEHLVAEPGEALEGWWSTLPKAPIALLHVGAGRADKVLTVDHYRDLAASAAAEGFAVACAYGPRDLHLAQGVAHDSAVYLAPPTSLMELGALMRRATVTLTADSGPLHMAVALGCPTAAFFRTTDPRRYGYDAPHLTIDLRHRPWDDALGRTRGWLAARIDARVPTAHSRAQRGEGVG